MNGVIVTRTEVQSLPVAAVRRWLLYELFSIVTSRRFCVAFVLPFSHSNWM
jgi:hypothetical protein